MVAFAWCILGIILVTYGFFSDAWPVIQWLRNDNGGLDLEALSTVHPIPCHSHNDYLRTNPLSTALLSGCSSVEADVWLSDEQELLVGHTERSLSPNRTLSSLYIQPLVDLLGRQVDQSNVLHRQDGGSRSTALQGVFETKPSQSLVLVIDFKSNGTALWPHVDTALDPLRQRGYLTRFDGMEVIPGQVTIVLSGNAPFENIVAQGDERDMFFDAPLQLMPAANSNTADTQVSSETRRQATDAIPGFRSKVATSSPYPRNPAVYSAANSYYASASFKRTIGHVWHSSLSDSQLTLIREQIRGAHARGLKVRYWGVPSWPIGVRNYLWRVLIREGVDVLSVDDVRAVATDNWGPRKGGCRMGDWSEDKS